MAFLSQQEGICTTKQATGAARDLWLWMCPCRLLVYQGLAHCMRLSSIGGALKGWFGEKSFAALCFPALLMRRMCSCQGGLSLGYRGKAVALWHLPLRGPGWMRCIPEHHQEEQSQSWGSSWGKTQILTQGNAPLLGCNSRWGYMGLLERLPSCRCFWSFSRQSSPWLQVQVCPWHG